MEGYNCSQTTRHRVDSVSALHYFFEACQKLQKEAVRGQLLCLKLSFSLWIQEGTTALAQLSVLMFLN